MNNDPTIPDRYRSDHLFLLVGKNPLPDYIAGKLLLKPGGQLYLVHSEATRPAANRLAKYLEDKEKHPVPKYVPVEEANSVRIRSQITSVLNGLNNGQVGLNYTGGTKLMSVHACRTLLDFQDTQQRPVTLSYLDARSDRMYIEHGIDPVFISQSVLNVIDPPPTLATIVGLHTEKLVSDPEKMPRLPELAFVLVKEHQQADVANAWRSWCDNALRTSTRTRDQNDWNSESALRDIQLPLPSDPGLARIVDAMRAILHLEAQAETISLATVAKSVGFKKAKHLCEWLDGKWLEYHVLHIINGLTEKDLKDKIHDTGMGIKPANEPEGSEYDVDIGVIHGYRLYAISCTTDDDKGMCKLKLFEAYERARNMGGDEARVGLICLNDNPKALEKQVWRSWDAEGKVRVFGRSDMSKLKDQLSKWFTGTGV